MRLHIKVWFAGFIKKWKYLLVVFAFWFIRGLAEDSFFGFVREYLTSKSEVFVSIFGLIQSNSWFFWLMIPVVIVILLIWTYIDSRKKEPGISIKIDKCYWGDSVIKYGQSISIIEVALTLSVENPPINVVSLQLCMAEERLEPINPSLPITQENEVGCYIAKYELSLATIYNVPIDSRSKFCLCVFARGQKRYSEEFSITIPSVGLGKSISLPNLKRESQQLSQDILQFLSDRQRLEPELVPTKKQRRKQTNDLIRHGRETVTLHHQRFGSRVISVYEHLRERGYSDKRVDTYYEHPTNELGIRELAQRLGALADLLP